MASLGNQSHALWIGVKGVPWGTSDSAVLNFFHTVNIMGEDLFNLNTARGDCFVRLWTDSEVLKLMEFQRSNFGKRYIELRRSSESELRIVMKQHGLPVAMENDPWWSGARCTTLDGREADFDNVCRFGADYRGVIYLSFLPQAQGKICSITEIADTFNRYCQSENTRHAQATIACIIPILSQGDKTQAFVINGNESEACMAHARFRNYCKDKDVELKQTDMREVFSKVNDELGRDVFPGFISMSYLTKEVLSNSVFASTFASWKQAISRFGASMILPLSSSVGDNSAFWLAKSVAKYAKLSPAITSKQDFAQFLGLDAEYDLNRMIMVQSLDHDEACMDGYWLRKETDSRTHDSVLVCRYDVLKSMPCSNITLTLHPMTCLYFTGLPKTYNNTNIVELLSNFKNFEQETIRIIGLVLCMEEVSGEMVFNGNAFVEIATLYDAVHVISRFNCLRVDSTVVRVVSCMKSDALAYVKRNSQFVSSDSLAAVAQLDTWKPKEKYGSNGSDNDRNDDHHRRTDDDRGRRTDDDHHRRTDDERGRRTDDDHHRRTDDDRGRRDDDRGRRTDVDRGRRDDDRGRRTDVDRGRHDDDSGRRDDDRGRRTDDDRSKRDEDDGSDLDKKRRRSSHRDDAGHQSRRTRAESDNEN